MNTQAKYRRLLDDDAEAFYAEQDQKDLKKHRVHEHRLPRQKATELHEKQFRCLQCNLLVTIAREQAGVNNRNHCPNCLWSLHVDLKRPGDRKANCHSRMQPIGLTLKKTHKKYEASALGELMLIHRCAKCGKFSINRIAADDSAGQLYQLYCQSFNLDTELRSQLAAQGVIALEASDLTAVYSQLFGWQAILEEFQTADKISALLVIEDKQRS